MIENRGASEDAALHLDVAAVGQLDVVPRILEVVCRTTGLGFAAVARVTEQRWIACAVRDEIGFGLKPSDELKVETTICNEIRQHGRLVVIDDVAGDEAFCDHVTPAQYGFRSYISVPIVIRDGTFFGTLCAIDPRPARLKAGATIDMFTLFADLIGRHLDARDRVVELERRVADRTAALSAVNAQLECAREDERTRIARELHDELGQGLTVLALDVAAAARTLDDASPDALERIRLTLESMARTDNTLDAVERIISELRPAVLDTLGLAAAAEWLVGEFARRTGVRTTCRCDEDVTPSPTVATAFFRILQEALTNVTRHARASHVTVVLQHDGDEVTLVVADDGRGIGDRAMAETAGWGVRGMRERLRVHGGALEIRSIPPKGTELVVRCRADGHA